MASISLSSASRLPGWVPGPAHESLLPSVARDIGLRAFKHSGEPGFITGLAEEAGISPSMAYRLRDKVAQRWEAYESQQWAAPAALNLRVDRAQIVRATVGARVDANCSVREIMALHGHFYGLETSFGFIQGVVSEHSQMAGQVLAEQPLGGIESAALDELFSQQEPVLVGIDLATEYVFLLQKAPDRSAKTWQEALEGLKPKGLSLKRFVSDAGKGVVHGAERAFPEADSRRDPFHVLDVLFDALSREERYAYSKLEEEEKTSRQLQALLEASERTKPATHRRRGRPKKTELQHRVEAAQAELEEVTAQAARQVGRHDKLLHIVRRAMDALEPVGHDGGLRTSKDQAGVLKDLAAELAEMKGQRLTRAATYLKNCSEAVSSYIDDVAAGLRALASNDDELIVVATTAALWRLGQEDKKKSMAYRRSERRREFRALIDRLAQLPLDGERLKTLMNQAERVLDRRARASSLAECLNSVLRPYLAVHKRVTQEALDLFCARWNFQPRTSGRLKGTSPFTALTGKKVHDWLSMIGAPATSAMH